MTLEELATEPGYENIVQNYIQLMESVDYKLESTFHDAIYERNDVICMHISKLFFLDWNDGLNKALGWSNKELGNIPWLDLVHPNDRLLCTYTAQENGLFFSQSKVHFFYVRYRHKNGTYRWFRFYKDSYLYKNAWYAIAEDVTNTPEEQEFLKILEEVRNGREDH